MGRQKKARFICYKPESKIFGVLNLERNPTLEKKDFEALSYNLVLTFDEYETIRLIDLYGWTQEECAKHMNVARTTVQSIYDSARKKIASCIVDNKILLINGGNCIFCQNDLPKYRQGCKKLNCRKLKDKSPNDSKLSEEELEIKLNDKKLIEK